MIPNSGVVSQILKIKNWKVGIDTNQYSFILLFLAFPTISIIKTPPYLDDLDRFLDRKGKKVIIRVRNSIILPASNHILSLIESCFSYQVGCGNVETQKLAKKDGGSPNCAKESINNSMKNSTSVT